MLLRICAVFLGVALAAAAEEAAFAGKNSLVNQWKDELARLRAARKVQPLAGCLHSEPVAWGRSYDVGGCELKDGRRLQLAVAAPDEWQAGRPLVLCYDEASGAHLLDPVAGKRYAVRHITGSHPIDGYLRSLHADTTIDLLAAGEEAQRLWRLELDRSVREVLALRHLPADVRANFLKLSRTRLDYLEQQSAFAVSAVYATYPGGTICGPASVEQAAALYRGAYFQLAESYEYYRSFNDPPGK